MGFSKQEYWSGLPFPSPGDLPQDEAVARHGVSREVPCSALKGETVPDSLSASCLAVGQHHCGPCPQVTYYQ